MPRAAKNKNGQFRFIVNHPEGGDEQYSPVTLNLFSCSQPVRISQVCNFCFTTSLSWVLSGPRPVKTGWPPSGVNPRWRSEGAIPPALAALGSSTTGPIGNIPIPLDPLSCRSESSNKSL